MCTRYYLPIRDKLASQHSCGLLGLKIFFIVEMFLLSLEKCLVGKQKFVREEEKRKKFIVQNLMYYQGLVALSDCEYFIFIQFLFQNKSQGKLSNEKQQKILNKNNLL